MQLKRYLLAQVIREHVELRGEGWSGRGEWEEWRGRIESECDAGGEREGVARGGGEMGRW